MKLLTFILTLALWFVFAGRVNIEVFLLGTIICSIISLMLADNGPKSVQMRSATKDFLLKTYYLFLVTSAFINDVFLSAVRVSRHAFEMKPSFSPQIVKLKTSLERKSSTEILANFITLPQGTLGMDIDISNKKYHIHWLDVYSEDQAEVKKAQIRKHEKLIAKLFD
ncbi:Na+/H+ antiporter subunit E [Aquibacillus albus]|uniref:Multicomponent Na+:H+ antiporter subunit E n=1 Tax=Aquibacillus albus TaxID=1168171 RepID=A0ABS2N0P4_9BACI|nr:Na+/H+ antiporter subunit E [Aquibacillus albus]MBM7571706.1 multicomponent Na+:H+ antiporter subunit E [Aquibacillus albus]